MSRVNCDVKGLMGRIEQVGNRATKGVSDVMRKYANLIIYDVVTRTAPHDTGALERSMMKWDKRGENGRLVIEIGVNPGAVNRWGQNVADYAEKVNKYMTPAPGAFINRGKGTRAKGKDAGGRFLIRAVQRWRAKLYAEVAEKVRKSIK